MKTNHSEIKRLAFIKYLYQVAVSQSHAPAPLNCASILTMHDAVELFLQVASEHLNVGGQQPGFMDYWDLLNKKLAPQELEQKESMRRLNKSRVALKHHGTFPSNLDIESFRASVTNFFEDNTPVIFGFKLADVSLIEFVNPESSRKKLKEAQQDAQNGDMLAALDKIALAFAEMIADYEERKRVGYHGSPFYFGRDLTFHNSFFMGLDSGSRKLGDFVDRVKESIETMQSAIKILALGLDYRKYSKFKQLTPSLSRVMSGDWIINRGFNSQQNSSEDDVLFCIDFVIESALALAEFDYTVQKANRSASLESFM